MARTPKPWWWKKRDCWAVQIGGQRHTEKTGIARDDLVGMAHWWQDLQRQLGATETDVGPLVGPITVDELCERYVRWDEARAAAGNRDPESQRWFASSLKRICLTEIPGGLVALWDVSQLGRRHFDQMVEVWSREFSPGYTRELAARIKTVTAWAAKDPSGPLIRTDPLARCPRPPAPLVEERFAERDEAAAWLRWLWRNPAVPRSYVLLQRVLIHTGARPSEWTRATLRELDVRHWQLVRREWKSARKKKKPRRIYVPVRLRRALGRLKTGSPPTDYIFFTINGVPWRGSNLSVRTQAYRRRAIADGVPLQDEGPDRLTCYRWRHTAASTLLMDGVDVATVAELLGTSPAMITKTYGHLLQSHLSAAAESLARRRR
jgi:integrase